MVVASRGPFSSIIDVQSNKSHFRNFFELFGANFRRLFPSGIPVFRASGRILGPPSAQGPHNMPYLSGGWSQNSARSPKKQVSGSGVKSELKKSKRVTAPPQFEAAEHVFNTFEARRVRLGSESQGTRRPALTPGPNGAFRAKIRPFFSTYKRNPGRYRQRTLHPPISRPLDTMGLVLKCDSEVQGPKVAKPRSGGVGWKLNSRFCLRP